MTAILTAGLSLKPQHYDAALQCRAEGCGLRCIRKAEREIAEGLMHTVLVKEACV
jgi:hypothetical protein